LLLGTFKIAQNLDHVLVVILRIFALAIANAISHQCKLSRYLDNVPSLVSTNVKDSTSNASFGFDWKGQHKHRVSLLQGRGYIPIKTSCSESKRFLRGTRC